MESLRRRDFIKGMSLLGVAAGVEPARAAYNPAAKFGVKVAKSSIAVPKPDGN
jgi:hypothetical protein